MIRRLKNLIYKFSVDIDFYDPRWSNHKDSAFRTQFFQIERRYSEHVEHLNQPWNNSIPKFIQLHKQIWDLYCELKLNPDELYEIVKEVISLRDKNYAGLERTPTRSKKDNGAIKVGSGGFNRNKIRFPKKCRKTAWKRFYKLFPDC